MDLGISGLRALVCGASRGLGFACAAALAAEGAEVTLVARNHESLVRAAAQIEQNGGSKVSTVAADVSTPSGREALLAASAAPDILVTNAGGPASVDFRALTLADWRAALDAGIARQLAPQGVTVNNLLPGVIETERVRELGQTAQELLARVPAGRAGTPDEFGAACAFLCSRQAAYITGQNLLVDGGLCPITV